MELWGVTYPDPVNEVPDYRLVDVNRGLLSALTHLWGRNYLEFGKAMGSTMAYYYTIKDGQYIPQYDEKVILYCYHMATLYPNVAIQADMGKQQ